MRYWLEGLPVPPWVAAAVAVSALFLTASVGFVLFRDPPPVAIKALPRSARPNVVEIAMFRSRPRTLAILEGECRIEEDGLRGAFDVQLVYKKGNTIALCPFLKADENDGACLKRQRFELVCKSDALVRAGRDRRRLGTRIRFDIRGKGLGIVAEIDLEAYVDAVVRSEHPRAPFEAQRAQSIVARTFALHAAAEPRHPEAPLCATQHCQVYKGAIADDAELGPRAAHATAEMVLVDEDEQIVPAFFHSTCGGRTLDAESVWPGVGVKAVVGIEDTDEKGQAWCRASRYHRWSYEVSDTALAGALSAAVGRTLKPKSLKIRQSKDGLALMISDGAGAKRVRGAKVHRVLGRKLGWDNVLSPRFRAKRRARSFKLYGTGLGHGVGLCQYGSQARAEAGQTAEQILEAYFPQLRVVSLKSRTAP